MDTWRTWELVLPALERRHDVLALTLPGHAGGPPLSPGAGASAACDTLEQTLDEAGIATAHLVGNSLGGYLALRLAERGRAASVVALAPAGGWEERERSFGDLAGVQRTLHDLARAAAPYADFLAASAEGRRRATELITSRFEHIPAELVAHQIRGVAACAARPLIDAALRDGFPLEPGRIACPLRIVWGTADRLLPWPSAAARFLRLFPHADWVELDGAGHCLQLDAPLETAELVLGFTAR